MRTLLVLVVPLVLVGQGSIRISNGVITAIAGTITCSGSQALVQGINSLHMECKQGTTLLHLGDTLATVGTLTFTVGSGKDSVSWTLTHSVDVDTWNINTNTGGASSGGQFTKVVIPPIANDWVMGFHDSKHTGTSLEIVKPPLTVVWTWQDPYDYDNFFGGLTAGKFWLPLYYKGKVCFQGGRNANRLFCLNSIDGSIAWESDNPGYTASGTYRFQFDNYPAIAVATAPDTKDRVIFASTDFTITVDAANGENPKNVYNTNGGWPSGGTASANGMAYEQFILTDNGNEFLGIIPDPTNIGPGSTVGVIGQASLGDNITTAAGGGFKVPAIDNGILYAHYLGQLTAWDATMHTPLWSWGVKNSSSSPAVANGVVFYYSSTMGSLVALKNTLIDTIVLWRVPMVAAYSPIVNSGIVYVAGTGDTVCTGGFLGTCSFKSNIYAIDATDGTIKWTFTTGASLPQIQSPTILQIPAISGGLIYIPGADGVLYVLDKLTGVEVWRYTGKAPWGPIVVGGGMVYVSDLNGVLYAFQTTPTTPLPTGSITFDASSTSVRYENATVTPWLHTMGSCANGFLVVGVGQITGYNVASVKYGGVVLKPSVFSVNPVGNAVSSWYLVNPPLGVHQIEVMLTGNWNGAGVGTDWGASEALSFCGVDPVNPIIVTHSNSGSDGIPINTIIPTVDTSFLVDILDITYNPASYFIPTSGWVASIHPESARTAITWRGPITPPMAISNKWQHNGGSPWVDIMIALNPANFSR